MVFLVLHVITALAHLLAVVRSFAVETFCTRHSRVDRLGTLGAKVAFLTHLFGKERLICVLALRSEFGPAILPVATFAHLL